MKGVVMGFMCMDVAGQAPGTVSVRPTTRDQARALVDEVGIDDEGDVVVIHGMDGVTRARVIAALGDLVAEAVAVRAGPRDERTADDEERAATRRVRTGVEKWDALVTRYGVLDAATVSSRLGSRSSNPSDLAARRARDGALLAVKRGNSYSFPTFQFDADSGAPLPGLREVLAVFTAAGWDPLHVALWFADPQGEMAGRCPADVLASDPEAVVAAARNRTDPW